MEEKKIMVNENDYEFAMSQGFSEDLAPVPPGKRKWNTFNYFTLWMGSVHNVPNYVAVGGFLFLGMSPANVMIALILSSFAVIALLVINGMPGFSYGIPFPVLLKSSYGEVGAKLPGILRGIIAAIMWYGLQTFSGSLALMILLGKIWPGFLELGGGFNFFGIGLPGLIAFAIFWIVNLGIGLGGGETISKFTAVLNPLIYIVFGGMLVWAIRVAGGIGNILNYSSGVQPANSHLFIYLMIISSVLSVWAAPGASAADFARNAKSYKAQLIGQSAGLFISYLLFAFSSVCILVGATLHYGVEMWNVLDIVNKWDSLFAASFAIIVLLMTTVSTNATGNIVPAGYQLASLFPKKLDYKQGVVVASVISFLIMPWKLMENATSIYAFLDIIGAVVGPVAGVMIAHYYFEKKQVLNTEDLYTPGDRQYANGINTKAFIATIVGLIFPIGAKFVPTLARFGSISWILGFGIAFTIYLAITRKK